jgi:hypothetical protein
MSNFAGTHPLLSLYVGCHDLACPSLRGVSEMPHTISCRLQSVSQRLVPGSGGERFAAGMDPLLRMRFAAQS